MSGSQVGEWAFETPEFIAFVGMLVASTYLSFETQYARKYDIWDSILSPTIQLGELGENPDFNQANLEQIKSRFPKDIKAFVLRRKYNFQIFSIIIFKVDFLNK